MVLSAIEIRRRFIISYWDAAIIEAARALGCEVVLSEDLSDGQDYAGVRVENPFRDC
jgi:predicted nucleic acid-binding protein